MFNSKCFSIISTVMTIITILVVVSPSGGCSTEQMQATAKAAKIMSDVAPTIAPLVPAITWPVWCVFGIDILSSLTAAIVAFRKQTQVVVE